MAFKFVFREKILLTFVRLAFFAMILKVMFKAFVIEAVTLSTGSSKVIH